MIGTRFGDWILEEHLAAGAMGTVYRARGVDDDTEVAIKLLHPHLGEQRGFFRRFEREAAIGLEIDHPNVVRVLDYEMVVREERPTCFLVMELVRGRSLRDLLHELGTVPESLLREIARDTAAGLAAIHAKGAVHRDLKPENVYLTDDGRIRILDLGVAKVLEESFELTRDGAFAGSLPYAAPEQLRGDPVGPAMDLYALGVVLYELATGANPFRKPTSAGVVHAQLHDVPPPASTVNDEISPFLSAVLGTLLSKRAEERVGTAADLIAILEDAESGVWWSERRDADERASRRRPTVPVRRETRLLGRDEDLEALQRAWAGARDGQGAVILLEGEAGIGKSRLVDAFLESVEDDAHVLYGSYSPTGGEGALTDAVLAKLGARDLEARLAPYLTVTPKLVPAFAALLTQQVAPEDAARLSGEALHAVFCHLARALSEERPLVWVVDDLHFATADARKLVLSLARITESTRMLVLVTTRPGLDEEDLAQYRRIERFERRPLGRLSPRDVVDLLQDALRSEALTEKLAARVAHKSDGVPFLVFEILRGLREGSFIEETADGTWVETRVIEEIEIPAAARDLIEARLADLSDDDRQILDVAAVQGYAFEADLVARVLERKRVEVLQRLVAIERRHGVVRSVKGGLRLDHHLIQEIVYGDLMEELRREYHALTAEALEKRAGAADVCPKEVNGEVCVRICEHALRGGRGEMALRYLDAAQKHLERGHQHEVMVELTEGALAVPDLLTGVARADALLRLDATLCMLGRWEQREALAREALQIATASGDKALWRRALSGVGGACSDAFRLDDAETAFRQLREEARECGHEPNIAGTSVNIGLVRMRRGDYKEAQSLFAFAGREFARLGEEYGAAAARVNLGLLLSQIGRHEEALDELSRAVEGFRRLGNHCGEAAALGNAALALGSMGRYADARAQQVISRDIDVGVGDRHGTAAASGGLASALSGLGRFGDAARESATALRLCREIGDPKGEAIEIGNSGVLAWSMGEADEAIRRHETHRELSTRIGYTRGVLFAEQNLADVTLALGRTERARAHLTRAEELARELGLTWFLVLIECEWARIEPGRIPKAFAALREHASALTPPDLRDAKFELWKATRDVELLTEARQHVDDLLALNPPEYHDSMLTNVRVNREIMEAWRAEFEDDDVPRETESETRVGPKP